MNDLPTLGVLGGMGPLATADFMRKIVEATPATRDQDHMPLMVHSVPQIPDRSEAFIAGSDAPWAFLASGIDCLESMKVDAIAVPCNTAHLWHDRISQRATVPVFHIGESAATAVVDHPSRIRRVGLLATSATIEGRIYQARLERKGVQVIVPDATMQDELVMRGIRAVKGGNLALGGELLHEASRRLQRERIEGLLLGCTELPVVMPTIGLGIPVFDTTDLLARDCVQWWIARREQQMSASA